jgi:ABC-type nickel/cobalt efflux system permease component RcnA
LLTTSLNQNLSQPQFRQVLHLDTAFAIALSTAFALGMEHAFEPDHVVAVSTIVTQSKGLVRSLLTGSLWGLGHTLALLTAGIIVILLRVRLPANISTTFELFVGLMLVILGLWAVLNARRQKLHFHVHSHDGRTHAHLHSHKEAESHDHPHIPFSVGVIHGLAGSGALVVLAMSTMADIAQGLFFIAAFGGGLIFAMSMIGSALNLPMSLSGKMSTLIGSVFSIGAGLLSLALGAFVVLGYFS